MIRDYSDLVDTLDLLFRVENVSTKEYVSQIMRETITEDSIDDAIENIWNIMVELKYEW